MDSASSLTIFLTAAVAGIGFLFKNSIEKNREIEKQLSEKKYTVYISVIELFFSVFSNIRRDTRDSVTDDDRVDKLFKIAEGLVVYGSDAVLKKYTFWKTHGSLDGDTALVLFTDVIIEIRKDMGNQNTKIDMDDLLGMIITDYESYRINLITAKNNILLQQKSRKDILTSNQNG